jgi:hypothetical protein
MLRRLGRFLPAIAFLLAVTPSVGAAGDNNPGSAWGTPPPHQTVNTGRNSVVDCGAPPPATAITCNVVASRASLEVSYQVSNGWACPLPAGTIQVMICAATPGSALAPNCRAVNQITVSAAAPFAAGTARDFSNHNPFIGGQASCTAREGN